jgi:formimidoylglutamate deiminase
MIAAAERHTPETVRREYAETYRELRAAGYTAVGEFHYLGLPEAHAALEAAHDAEIEIVLLLGAYARGGIERFRQESTAEYFRQLEELRESGARVGCAPHSVRACPPDWLEEIGAYAERERLPLHVHADEQPREIDGCLEEHGVRPIELLSSMGCLGPRTTVVHATHADDRELDLLAEAGARVCICPTTEANLGDGFAPLERLRERGIGICIGSDSNVRIDPLEELRELETTARRQTLSREVVDAGTLLCFGADEGAASLGLESWPDAAVDLEHPSLRGVDPADVLDALVFGCGADVFVES